MPIKFNLDKIKFATDEATFNRAVELYQEGKVKQFEKGIASYTAIVEGTKPYNVFIEERQFGLGDCNCYLGQKDYLCKHIVAVSIYAVKDGKPLSSEEMELNTTPKCSGRRGELLRTELSKVKQSISSAIRYIKPYVGPSRTWFIYQGSLSEGCRRLSSIISDLPVSYRTADLLVDLLLRLDKRLSIGGVDDSDGTVGDFISEVVLVLKELHKLDPDCVKAFEKLKNQKTSFGWEEPLIEIFTNKNN